MCATAKSSTAAKLEEKQAVNFDRDRLPKAAMKTLGISSECCPGWVTLKFRIQSYAAACHYSFAFQTPTRPPFK